LGNIVEFPSRFDVRVKAGEFDPEVELEAGKLAVVSLVSH
jgi:hypothetical protein